MFAVMSTAFEAFLFPVADFSIHPRFKELADAGPSRICQSFS
jgi:hypothetical protein